MKYCPKCKIAYQDTETTCPVDGAPLQSEVAASAAPTGGAKCPACGALSHTEAAYCADCGAKLGSHCPKCSASVRDGDKFCPSCGECVAPKPTPAQPVEETALVAPGWVGPLPGVRTNSFNPDESNSRLMRISLNTLMLKQLREQRMFPRVQPPSPQAVQAVVRAVEAHIANLQQESRAQEFLPHAMQAAAAWLVSTLSMGPLEWWGTAKVEAWPLPLRYKAILRNPASHLTAMSLADLVMGLDWPANLFYEVEATHGDKHLQFGEVVSQSLRELFYLTYPTIALKERFLSEEDAKLRYGYYPDSIRRGVEQILGTLRKTLSKMTDAIAQITGGEQNFLLMRISPLSIPLVAATCSTSTRNLSEVEQRVFAYFINHGLHRVATDVHGAAELLTFFLGMREEQGANADKMPVQHPMYTYFEMAHYFLTRYCNILGPRVHMEKYTTLSHRVLRVPGVSWAMVMHAEWQKFDQMASALVPECTTIEALEATLNQVLPSHPPESSEPSRAAPVAAAQKSAQATYPASGPSSPTNDLEKDLLGNALSGYTKGIDNKLLAGNVYTVPVDSYIKPNSEDLGIRVCLGSDQGKPLYVYTSPSMFASLPLSEQSRMFGGEYYKKTGQMLAQQWSLQEILKKCEELNSTGMNINTGCGQFECYLSAKDAKALLQSAPAAPLNVQLAATASVPTAGSAGASPSAVRAKLHMFATEQGGRHTPVVSARPYRPQLIPEGTNDKLNAEITGNFAPISPGTSAMVSVRLGDGRPVKQGDKFIVWEEETDPLLTKFGVTGLGAVGELEVA